MSISPTYITNIDLSQNGQAIEISAVEVLTQQVTATSFLTGPKGDKGDKGDTGAAGTTDYNQLENLPDLSLKSDVGHTHTATQITDFDTEVSNNPTVAANTTARHTHANSAVLNATTASFTTADENKLGGIATGATANATDTQLRDRATHTGSQAIDTVTGLQTALDSKQPTGDYATNTALTDGLATKSPVGHTHDDRYYTEAETDAALDAKAEDADVLHKSSDETKNGTLTFTTAKGIKLSAQTGNSLITKNIELKALDDYSRPWVSWLDKNNRHQAASGWHGINSDDGITHNAWEVKTSVSPTNPSPTIMQTRIGIQSDKDKADFVMNYLDTLRLYKGDGSSTQTVNVIADTGNIDTLGALTSKDVAGTSYLTIYKKPTAGSMLQSAEATGSATLDLEATPLDGTSSGIVRLFRNTSTTNTGTGFFIYNATNANVVQHFLGAKGNTYFNAFGGSLMVGKSSSPQAKLDVNGDVQVAGRIKGVSAPTAGTDAATKEYVDTAGWVATPATATSAGTAGQKAYDANYMYICVATNTWKRSPLSSW